jgi:hypothetical protein
MLSNQVGRRALRSHNLEYGWQLVRPVLAVMADASNLRVPNYHIVSISIYVYNIVYVDTDVFNLYLHKYC